MGPPGDGITPQTDKSRCYTCRKKCGLTGFTCRCTFTFCAAHRYPDQHVCTFDFKGHDRALLAKQNPKLVAAKLNGDTL